MKVALAILGACPPDKLALSIAAQDTAMLRQADGVGPKLATRIVTELKDKAGKMAFSAPVPKKSSAKSEGPSAPDIDHDAVSALINLGYPRAEAYSAVLQVKGKSNDNYSLQDLIRLALKELAS
jgi:Holliday junction DNA helicase RuvA